MRNHRRKRRLSEFIFERKILKSAKPASTNAQRTSRALNIPFEIIKDGELYVVSDGKLERKRAIRKAIPEIKGLTKGSKLCLK